MPLTREVAISFVHPDVRCETGDCPGMVECTYYRNEHSHLRRGRDGVEARYKCLGNCGVEWQDTVAQSVAEQDLKDVSLRLAYDNLMEAEWELQKAAADVDCTFADALTSLADKAEVGRHLDEAKRQVAIKQAAKDQVLRDARVIICHH